MPKVKLARALALALSFSLAAPAFALWTGNSAAGAPVTMTGASAGSATALPSRALTFKAQPEGEGPNITLGDLIEQRLPAQVAAIVVQAANGPGTTVFVDPALVDMKLRLAPGGPWHLRPGYNALRVPVPAQKISGRALYDFAYGYLQTSLSGTSGTVIKPQGKVFGLTLYDAPTRFRVRPPDDHALSGYVELRVDVLQSSGSDEDKVVDTMPVSFLVERSGPRLFTTGDINPGDPLGPQNLALQVVDTTFAPDGFDSLSRVQGRVAKAYIPAGRMLDSHMVDLPLAIHRGDEVRLLVRSGAIEVQTTAEAMRDAHVGESLPLRVQSSDRQVQARCVDSDVAVENAW
ncbi:MAG: flagellar basal body P-ring formation chaperone FlgA [bacterium]